MKAIYDNKRIIIQNFERHNEEVMYNKIVNELKDNVSFIFVRNILGPSENTAIFKCDNSEIQVGYDIDYGLNEIYVANEQCANKIVNTINKALGLED